ncbi:hypothetical protein OH76DRAFT_1181711 [Lentinus brumalis]|uniref:Uncharacterized protein n=1 Tax=Lentinus brumalis TaxID=2498619 RepID=A0A371CTW5_9APHY|nr:hypothetical protein OH76DRAFT_1181711 [Polyporus brumalis]
MSYRRIMMQNLCNVTPVAEPGTPQCAPGHRTTIAWSNTPGRHRAAQRQFLPYSTSVFTRCRHAHQRNRPIRYSRYSSGVDHTRVDQKAVTPPNGNPVTLSPLSKRSEPYNLRRVVPRVPVSSTRQHHCWDADDHAATFGCRSAFVSSPSHCATVVRCTDRPRGLTSRQELSAAYGVLALMVLGSRYGVSWQALANPRNLHV